MFRQLINGHLQPKLSDRYEISCPLYPLPTPYKQPMYVLYNCLISISLQPEDGHYQAPKHVVVPYVENNLYSTNKYSSLCLLDRASL